MSVLQIVYDNTSAREDLQPDWGFAAVIEGHDKKILFDTGGNGEILMKNFDVLKIDPASITDVFISHGHFDHIGGLSHFLNANSNVVVHAPDSFRGVRYAVKMINYKNPSEIYPGYFTSGELDNIEQSLGVATEKGLIVISGCAHPPIEKTFAKLSQFGKIDGIIGGLHDSDQYHLFKDLKLVCPTHCTSHIEEIRQSNNKAYIAGGAGVVINLY